MLVLLGVGLSSWLVNLINSSIIPLTKILEVAR